MTLCSGKHIARELGVERVCPVVWLTVMSKGLR